MKIYVERALISHETAAIGENIFVIELAAPRERWAVMGEDRGLVEPIANFDDRNEAEDAASRLRTQLAELRKHLQ